MGYVQTALTSIQSVLEQAVVRMSVLIDSLLFDDHERDCPTDSHSPDSLS